jgi:MFS family permease
MGTDLLAEARPTSTTRAFWTYWTAGTTSSVGDAVTAVALPLAAVTVLRSSPFEVGVLTAASWVAWAVIGLPAGVVVGRLPLRGTQVVMDLVRAAALVSLPVAWWLGSLTFVHLLLTALVISFANVVFSVGNSTFLPAIVPKAELNARNSLMSATHAGTQLGGPSLGGVLVQVLGAVPAVLADAASYLVSAALLSRLPARQVPASPAGAKVGAMIREGWRFVSRHPVMGPCMWSATATNFVCGALMALSPLYLVRVLHAAPGLVGVLIATEGVGALVGAALTPRLTRLLGSARSVILSELMAGCWALLLPLGHGAVGMAAFAVGNAGFATGVVIDSINTRTYRQTQSPPELLARVMATVRFVSWGAIPAGALAAGAASDLLGIRPALWLTAALAFLPLVPLWLSPVRHLRDLDGERTR